MSAERQNAAAATQQPSMSTATTSQPMVVDNSLTAPKDGNICLESEVPTKPPRQRQRANQPVETTIDNIDDGGHDVSFQEVCVWVGTNK